MEYKLIIAKENGDISAELQTLDQSHRQAFNLLDVILDYTNIKRTEHGKRGRPWELMELVLQMNRPGRILQEYRN